MTTSDFGKDVESLAEVFAEEVAAELLLQTIDDSLNGLSGTDEGIEIY